MIRFGLWRLLTVHHFSLKVVVVVFNGTLYIYNYINKVVVSEGEELGSNLEKILGQTPLWQVISIRFLR